MDDDFLSADWVPPDLQDDLDLQAAREQRRLQRRQREQATLVVNTGNLSVPYVPEPPPGNTRTITGTSGQSLGRGKQNWKHVLLTPVNLVGGGKMNYALVYCEETVSGILREGVVDEKATFTFFKDNESQVLTGRGGLNEALNLFFKSLRRPRRKRQ
jgi:hypothetical protein